jgi:hypothetical protein
MTDIYCRFFQKMAVCGAKSSKIAQAKTTPAAKAANIF